MFLFSRSASIIMSFSVLIGSAKAAPSLSETCRSLEPFIANVTCSTETSDCQLRDSNLPCIPGCQGKLDPTPVSELTCRIWHADKNDWEDVPVQTNGDELSLCSRGTNGSELFCDRIKENLTNFLLVSSNNDDENGHCNYSIISNFDDGAAGNASVYLRYDFCREMIFQIKFSDFHFVGKEAEITGTRFSTIIAVVIPVLIFLALIVWLCKWKRLQQQQSAVSHAEPKNELELPLLPRQSMYFNVREVPYSFQERKQEMEKLTLAFQSAVTSGGEKTNETNTLIIHGEPGAGKTSLAASFVHNHGKELKDFHVLWIDADSKRSILHQFVQASEHHFPKLSLGDKGGQLLKDDQVMSDVYNQLTQTPSLIIFDNAASGIKNYGIKEEIGEFFPKSIQPGNFHPVFLITTRTGAPEAWNCYSKNMLELGSFSWEDCWAYMKKRLPVLSEYKDGCQRLCEFFKGLPCAIEHAVNLMKFEASFCVDEANYNPKEFVNMALAFQRTSPAYVEGMDMDLSEKLNCLWDYSIKLLRNAPRNGEFAIYVLDVMALLSSTGIPHHFLLEIIKGYVIPENERCELQYDQKDVEDLVTTVIGVLQRYSIVQKRDQLLYVHVLLQEHRRKCLKEAKRLIWHVVAIAESMIQIPELTSYKKKDEYAHIFKNINRVCRAILEYVQDNADELKIKCARFVADILPQTALDLLQTNSDTLEILEIKSDCYLNLGSYNQALQNVQQCFNMSAAKFGWETLLILPIYNKLATVLCKLGNYKEALKLSKEMHDFCISNFDEEHLDTLIAKSNMANFYSELGNYAEALRLSKEVHHSRCRILGKMHRDTLTAKSDIAVYSSKLGKTAEALRLSKEVHDNRCRNLGEEHLDTLTAKSNMAFNNSKLGNYAEALRSSKEVHDSLCSILGEEHPDTLTAKNNMANFYSELGNYAEAFELSKEVYDSRCRILGVMHPDTLSAKNNMATHHSELGNYAEALGLSKEVHRAYCRILGEEHPHTLTATNNMANCYSQLGHYAEAFELSKEVYDSRCRILGEEHPDTLDAKKKLAIRYSDVGSYA